MSVISQSEDQHKRSIYVSRTTDLPAEALQESLPAPDQSTMIDWLFKVPWWALFMAGVALYVGISIAADEVYSNIYRQLKVGIKITLQVSIFSYLFALLIGAVIGVIRSSEPVPKSGFLSGALSLLQLFLYNVATVFVEVLRGLPILVALLIGAFIVTPEIRGFLNDELGLNVTLRGMSVETAIIVLSLAYGAFLSEVFRSGIQSIDKGQIEASKSLGMTAPQTMWYIILPQAFKRILPPLGNDFIAMIKDSSLVAFLGVQDITQIGKKVSGASFKVMETYLTVAVIYLTLTIIGSIIVRFLETWINDKGEGGSVSAIIVGFLKSKPTAVKESLDVR